jgi:ankyrin repeat protein
MLFKPKAPKCTCGGKTKPIGKQIAPGGEVIRLFHCRSCGTGTLVPEGSELVGRIASFECCGQPRQYLGGGGDSCCGFTCVVCGLPRAIELEPETLPEKIAPCRCAQCSTEFHRAVHELEYKVVAKFIKLYPATLTTPCEHGWTLLHHATLRGAADMVRLLAGAGCDVNARDSNGRTPLHTAVLARLWKHSNVPTTLLVFGADPHLTNTEGQTPLGLARLEGQSGVAEQIEEHLPIALPRRFLFAAYHGHLDVVRELLTSNPELVQASLDYDATALHLAVQQGQADVVKLLLDHGAPIQARAAGGGAIMPTVLYDGLESDDTPFGLAAAEPEDSKLKDLIPMWSEMNCTTFKKKRRDVKRLLRDHGIQPAPVKKRNLTIQCPECQRVYTVKKDFFGKRSKCACGYQIEFPEPDWLRSDRRKHLRPDLTGIESWPIHDAHRLRRMLVFLCQLLPQVRYDTIVKHYNSLIDPVSLSSAAECVDDLLQHITERTQSGLLWCLRHREQCFVKGKGDIDWAKVQVQAENYPAGQPMYFVFRTERSEFLIDRPRWGEVQRTSTPSAADPQKIVEMQLVRKCRQCGYVETCDHFIKAVLAKSGGSDGESAPGAAIECCKCGRAGTEMVWRSPDGRFFKTAVKASPAS